MCRGSCENFEKMNKQSNSRISNQPLLDYWLRPNKRISSDLADFALENDTSNICYARHRKDSSNINEQKSSKILSTGQIISISGQVLNLASRPLAFFQPKGILHQENDGSKDVIFNNVVEVNGKALTSPEIKKKCVDIRTDGQWSPIMQPTLDCLTVTQKMSVLEPCKNHSMSSFQSLLHGGNDMSDKAWKGKGLGSAKISHNLGKIYGWMNHTSPSEACYPVKVANAEIMKANAFKARGGLNEAGGYMSGGTNFLVNELINETSKNAPIFQPMNLSPPFIKKLEMKMMENVYMASRIHTFVKDSKADVSILGSPDSDISAANSPPSNNGALDKLALESTERSESREHREDKTKLPDELIVENEFNREDCFLISEKSCYSIAKQGHAFAGAMAGVFVSLFLHPVDTIKTVFQSYHAERKSLSYIGKSIVCDRGLSGLYRGISTNIASSAPTSAIYTFTYESVKGALLPLFQEEYRSCVHCAAGGCASIATSFIFTPSERIKQQMQVSAHYHNCWNAFVGVVAKGGLRGLYTGWGAVLCRNVPHSIIKFYTYESLKGLMKSNAQQSTSQTLVCGGVAGSTAALFTTPFDVVKTRLQTQRPGSLSPYKNVIQALYEIGHKEGLEGLYRGLTPRLVMYMSQGAIFFASYEFLKRLLSLEEPQHATRRVQCQQDAKPEI